MHYVNDVMAGIGWAFTLSILAMVTLGTWARKKGRIK